MKSASSVMTVFMLVIFVTMVAVASSYPEGARFMPFVVGIPGIVLCLLQLVLDSFDRRRVAMAGDGRSELEKAQDEVSRIAGRKVEFQVAREKLPTGELELTPEETVNREITAWAYFLGLIAGILLFGFWVSIPVFLLVFLRFQAGASWRITLMLAIGVSILLYLMFEIGLRFSLHQGLLTPEFVKLLPILLELAGIREVP